MREEEGKWPRSFEFPFHGGKRRWVAPADAENMPKLKLFFLKKSKSTERPFLQGVWEEKPQESTQPYEFGCHGALEAPRVNGTFPCDKCGVKPPVLQQERGPSIDPLNSGWDHFHQDKVLRK